MKAEKVPFYFPLQHGRYDVTPGLSPLSSDFGNGKADKDFFQFDSIFALYRQEKRRARNENLDKYYCRASPTANAVQQAKRHIIEQLCRQHTDKFILKPQSAGYAFHSNLSGETLLLDANYALIETLGSDNHYRDSFDALANQVQEDFALLELSVNDTDSITLLHLCFPNHWSAQDKIGRAFFHAHQVVPGMQRINANSQKLLHNIVNKGPFVRFAWGLATDTRLNHHPDAPGKVSGTDWQGRSFNKDKPELYLRVERQVIQGFPESRALLFTIRTYHYDVAEIKKDPAQRQALHSALNSMNEASLHYKGLAQDKTAICEWLETE